METKNLPLIMRTFGTQNQILKGIQTGQLFGFIVADVKCPPEIYEKLRWINFPPVIQRMDLNESHLSPYMKTRAEAENVKLPRSTVVQTYNGTQLLLLTDLAAFYMKLGLVVENVTKFLQYEPRVVLKDFVDTITHGRIAAIESKNPALGLAYKVTGNRYV